MTDTVSVPVPVRAVQKRTRLLGLLAKRKRSTFGRDNLAGYLFISPWLIAFILFSLLPIGASLMLAFTDYDVLQHSIFKANWNYVRLDNFERMFYQDFRYWKSVRATLRYVAYTIPFRLIFALAVAMLLNTKRRGVYFYRAAYYAPSVIGGSIAVAVMWRQIFGMRAGQPGLVNSLLDREIYWFGDPHYAIWTLVMLAIWQFGSPMLIFLAGLRQIPSEYYEAASIDGANAFQRFRKITLPLLTPIIFFNLVMQTIHGFQQFTQAYVVTGGNGAPRDTTLLYPLYLYRRAFGQYQMGYASAMAWVLLAVIAFFTAMTFLSSRFWVYYQGDEK